MTKSTIRKSKHPRASQDEAALGKKLDDLAEDVLSRSATMALNGPREPQARAFAETIRKATEFGKKCEAADKLAAVLLRGNVAAQEIAAKIQDLIQLRLPGMEEEAEQQAGSYVPAEPAVAAMPEKASPVPPEPLEKPDPADVPAEPAKAPEITWMSVEDIVTREPFSSLLPIRPDIVKAIVASMEASGFDPSQPLVIWTEENVPVDGHTRLKAAREAGLKKVAVYHRSFASEDEAVEYAIHAHRDRRNLTDADIFHLVQALDQRKKRGGDRRSGEAKSKTSCEVFDRSSAETAKLIGTTKTKVENARAVIDSVDATLQEKVEAGSVSLNRAAGVARNTKKGQVAEVATDAIARDAAKAMKALSEVIGLLEPWGEAMGDIPARLKAIGVDIENAYKAITGLGKSKPSQSREVAHAA